jgi:hypothetical protein
MKIKLLKLFLFVPVILFADWVILSLMGCIAGSCNAGHNFFCKVFCYFGIGLVVASLLGILYIVFRKYPTGSR